MGHNGDSGKGGDSKESKKQKKKREKAERLEARIARTGSEGAETLPSMPVEEALVEAKRLYREAWRLRNDLAELPDFDKNDVADLPLLIEALDEAEQTWRKARAALGDKSLKGARKEAGRLRAQ